MGCYEKSRFVAKCQFLQHQLTTPPNLEVSEIAEENTKHINLNYKTSHILSGECLDRKLKIGRLLLLSVDCKRTNIKKSQIALNMNEKVGVGS